MISFRQLSGNFSLLLLSTSSQTRIGRWPLLSVATICGAAIFLSILFGVLQWSLTKKLSETLDRVVSGNLSALSISQRMTTSMGDAHRFTIRAALANTDSEREYVAQKRAESFADYARLLKELKAMASLETSSLVSDCEAYKIASDGMYQMVLSGRKVEALELRTSTVRPAFEAWQEEQTKVGSELLEQANQENRRSQMLLQKMSHYLSWAIILPILLGGACLMIVILLLLVQISNSAQVDARDMWGN
jgi:methyl-accepting chemotaxis protein-1 (serine sensor receptor)